MGRPRRALGIGFLLVVSAIGPVLAAQSPPVHVRAPIRDPGWADSTLDSDKLLEAYLRTRFVSLGVPLTEADTVNAADVDFIVVPVPGGTYDITAFLVLQDCRHWRGLHMCRTSLPFDWMHFHDSRDLESVARQIAEFVFKERAANPRWLPPEGERRPPP